MEIALYSTVWRQKMKTTKKLSDQKTLPILFLFLFALPAGVLLASDFNFSWVGEWRGTGPYEDIYVNHDYVYCAASSAGVDVIHLGPQFNTAKWVGSFQTSDIASDIHGDGNIVCVLQHKKSFIFDLKIDILDVSQPDSIRKVGEINHLTGFGDVYVSGKYLYTITFSHLNIYDISDPSAPQLISSWHAEDTSLSTLFLKGKYVYLDNLLIVDISNPANPKLKGRFNCNFFVNSIHINGNYLCAAGNQSVKIGENTYAHKGVVNILDVSDPTTPTLLGIFKMDTHHMLRDAFISHNRVYTSDHLEGFYILDISEPSKPVLLSTYSPLKFTSSIYVRDNYAYAAALVDGFSILDVSNPSIPTLADKVDFSGYGKDLFCTRNNVYLADAHGGLHIIDVSDPAAPFHVGSDEQNWGNAVFVNGSYAYLVAGSYQLLIIDISTPSSPKRVGIYKTPEPIWDIYVRNNYAYVGTDGAELHIVDVSNPSSPALAGKYSAPENAVWKGESLEIKRNKAYVASRKGLEVIDISDPTAPVRVGVNYNLGVINDLKVMGNYAYCSDNNGLRVIDISNPSSMWEVGNYYTDGAGRSLVIKRKYVYLTTSSSKVLVFDVSVPSQPRLMGSYQCQGLINAVGGNNRNVFLLSYEHMKLSILTFNPLENPPRIEIDKNQLNFGLQHNGLQTGPQSFFISNPGEGDLHWSAAVDEDIDFITVSPGSGTNDTEVWVAVDTKKIRNSYSKQGTITISSPDAVNSPRVVEVKCRVYSPGYTSPPFGVFSTPGEMAVVSGNLPFSGWALDDIGVASIQLFWEQEETHSLVYISDALQVEGVRPDVHRKYSNYPLSEKAGWGYMMLSHDLPRGDGWYTIHATATDIEGNRVTLGTRTLRVDNTNAVKPFGNIDPPQWGGLASGSDYINSGWALTPPPNTIPIGGSSITVWVDGIPLGNPVYNRQRQDIAIRFPHYNNSQGAGGYFHLDTTQLENGIHTISWSVADDAGNVEGIGSRYFTIRNATASTSNRHQIQALSKIPMALHHPIRVLKGYSTEEKTQDIHPREDGTTYLEVKELERIEIQLYHGSIEKRASGTRFKGYLLQGKRLFSLPTGSLLDDEGGIFYWQLGPGFLGEYLLVFVAATPQGNQTRQHVLINVIPRFTGN
jgi:hypothetical protein